MKDLPEGEYDIRVTAESRTTTRNLSRYRPSKCSRAAVNFDIGVSCTTMEEVLLTYVRDGLVLSGIAALLVLTEPATPRAERAFAPSAGRAS